MPDRTRHPETAVLLALLDGELASVRAWRTRRHIDRCWACRGRLVELEQTIADVGRTFAAPPGDIDRTDTARARWDFRRAVAEIEAAHPAPESSPRRFVWITAAFAAALTVAVLIAPWGSAPTRSPKIAAVEPQRPVEFLAAVQAREQSPIRAVREDRFSVELQTGKPVRPVSRELRVLTAPGAGLHSARWLDRAGVLQNAVFAADSEEQAIYSRTAGLQPVRLRKPSGYRALYRTVATSRNPDSLEAAVLDWIRSQVWEPVSLAREAADFSTASGAVLRVRQDAGTWVWTAEAPVGAAVVHLTLRGPDHQPASFMEITWRSPEGEGSVSFRRETQREYPTLASAPVWLRASALRRAPPQLEPAPAMPASVSRLQLLDAEVEAVAALHKAALCSRDNIRVSAGANTVRITGTVVGEAERERIETLLRAIPHASLLTFELAFLEIGPLPAPAPPPTARTGQQSRPAPAEPWLRARMGVGTKVSEREMFTRMNVLISSAEDVVADAWAVEMLAEQFPPSRQALMSADTKALFSSVMDDHARSASQRLARIASLLGLPRTAGSPLMADLDPTSFRKSAQRFSDTMLALFASSETAAATPANPEQSGLPELLQQLQTSVITQTASR